MNCVNCGAPLPPTSNICTFCETLNDTDLRAIGVRRPSGTISQRTCPRCSAALATVRIGATQPLTIERCAECLGLFFDPGELEAVLDDSVTPVYGIDYQRLHELNERERKAGGHDADVRYLKCPECGELMMRRNFGARSGVVIDTCRPHGIWVDAGELGHLLRWIKAGGRVLDKQRQEEAKREAEREARVAKAAREAAQRGQVMGPYSNDLTDEPDLIRFALRLLCDWF